MQSSDFQFYQQMLLEKSGLALTPEKTYLLETRLTPVAHSLGYSDLDRFTVDVRLGADLSLRRAVVEAMTTNETSFFRDMKPFGYLKDKILPRLIATGRADKTIRIWSAACSGGQEPYSIAMVVADFLAAHPDWKVQILGTEISEEMLAQCRKGEYNQFEIQRGLTIQQMMKYFTQQDGVWHIKDQVKNMVRFQNFNLLSPMSLLGKFDVIFCRNVLIYFNRETKTQVLTKMAERLTPEGLLVLGISETVMGLPVPFQPFEDLHGVLAAKTESGAAQFRAATT